MGVNLCISITEISYDALAGTPPQILREMTLEEIEEGLGRQLDHEDMEYVTKETCRECMQKQICGEYNR